MLFHSTDERAHKLQSCRHFLNPQLGLFLAGSLLLFAVVLVVTSALSAAKPQQAASQAPAVGPPAQATAGGSVVFATQIRPILAARCYPCHGPDVQQHGLRMDSLQRLLTGGMN